MTSPIAANRIAMLLAQQTRQRASADREVAVAETQGESTAAGVQVSFSDALRERMKAVGEIGNQIRSKLNQTQESRKEAARQRIEEIKKRIKMLKDLAASGLASKGMLRQIQQLARELGQAASVLKEGTTAVAGASLKVNASPTDTQPAEGEVSASDEIVEVDETAATLPSEQAASASSEEQVAADNTDEDKAANAAREAYGTLQSSNSDDKQRKADAEAIRSALRELKGLLAIVKAAGTSGDEETQKQIKGIQKQMADIEKLASDVSGGGIASLGSISISV